MKIGVKAVQIAIAGFVVPYMAVYAPALMLQGEWTIGAVAYVVFKALLAIGLWGAAAIGYLWQPLGPAARLFAALAAFMLVAAIPLTDEIGFALCAIFIGWQAWRRRGSHGDSLRASHGDSLRSSHGDSLRSQKKPGDAA